MISIENEFSEDRAQASIRSAEPIGFDRFNRCYWVFNSCPYILWIETRSDSSSSSWLPVTSSEDFATLLKWFDVRGIREKALKKDLQNLREELVENMDYEDRSVILPFSEILKFTKTKPTWKNSLRSQGKKR
ncbi:hypothetical protein RCL1_001942 [Eukaryota sp. TZLM3-RCL]